jgi:site-specific DNA-adenine methylase
MTQLTRYPGGKNGSGVYQTIINNIPPHTTYIEAFGGSLAVFRRIRRSARMSIVNDINPVVVKGYDKEFNFSAIIYNRDAVELLNLLKHRFEYINETFVIYLDPPYPFSSRKSDKPIYKYEMSDEDHIRLCEKVIALSNKYHNIYFLISTYPNDIYEKYFEHWRLVRFYAQTRKGKALEYLYCNFEKPRKLHDYRYLGNNFRERERIQRKIERKVQGLLKLPCLEKNAIIQAIQERVVDPTPTKITS